MVVILYVQVIQMSFQEVILLLSLLGGAIYGTIQVCYIVFRKNEKKITAEALN